MNNGARELDVVVWGATGFTGGLVAAYLARHRPSDLRWGIGGRDEGKLEATRRELAAIDDRLATLPLLIGDSHDRNALDEVAARARVVCSTVGPFAKDGAPLVAACVARGTHYCDITGETHFIRGLIDAHHDEARRTGTRIVCCCGFDSIPSDLGCQLLQETTLERHGSASRSVTLYVDRVKGGMSGGTIASMANLMEEASRDPSIRRIFAHPYALNPEGERSGADARDSIGVARAPDGRWTAPFVMGAINTRIVRRSHALLGRPWGDDFRYDERMCFDAGPKGLLRATAMAGGIGAFTALMIAAPTRKLLSARVLPKPGQGPSRSDREGGYWRIRLVGGVGPHEVTVRVEGDGDPGYHDTAIMLGQSALCLARDELSSEGGVITPSVAMGHALRDRLRAAGLRFDAA